MQLAVEPSPRTLRRMEVVDTSMTKEDYIKVERSAKSGGANINLSYRAISQAKKTCYPDSITVSECETPLPLQPDPADN